MSSGGVASRRIDRGATQKTQGSITHSIQAPTGGLNAVDALANMPETDAVVLNNWFPHQSYCDIRNGYIQYTTGFGHWVETLMEYQSAAGSKLFAMSNGKVYDATAGGAVGAAVVTGLTNARWEYTNLATPGGQFLYAGNGVDKPLYYDGSAWVKVDGGSTPAITGVTTTKLRSPVVWKNRLWWVEDGTMHVWYLPTASVGGAASQIDLGMYFKLGGQMHVIMTASLTDGSTFDDYILFLSTEGEILLYRGTDPSTASLFNLVGIYRVGSPVGRRCWFKNGSDTILICSDGFVSLTKEIGIGRINQGEDISYKILSLVNTAIQSYKGNFGWEGLIYPLGNKLIINVPVSENNTQTQFVMNSINNAWCTYSGWNAATYAQIGDTLYFGGNGYVAKADDVSYFSDAGSNIVATMKTAFSYMGSDSQKFWKMARPLLSSNAPLQAALNINVDFQDNPPTSSPTFSPVIGSPWDTSPWDTSPWTAGLTTQRQWQTVAGVGFCAALYIVAATNSATVQLLSTDFLYSPGGVL